MEREFFCDDVEVNLDILWKPIERYWGRGVTTEAIKQMCDYLINNFSSNAT